MAEEEREEEEEEEAGVEKSVLEGELGAECSASGGVCGKRGRRRLRVSEGAVRPRCSGGGDGGRLRGSVDGRMRRRRLRMEKASTSGMTKYQRCRMAGPYRVYRDCSAAENGSVDKSTLRNDCAFGGCTTTVTREEDMAPSGSRQLRSDLCSAGCG